MTSRPTGTVAGGEEPGEDPLGLFPSEHQHAIEIRRAHLLRACASGGALVAATSRYAWRFAAASYRMLLSRVLVLRTYRLPELRVYRFPELRLPVVWFVSRCRALWPSVAKRQWMSTVTVGAFACGLVIGGSVVWLSGGSRRTSTEAEAARRQLQLDHARVPVSSVAASPSPVALVDQRTGVPGTGANKPSAASRRPSSRGSLIVESRPSGARVPVSSVAASPSPVALVDQRTGVSGTGANKLSAASRRPPFRGSLVVESRPSGAYVFLNGQSVGTTPLVLRNQPAGSRAVRVALDGYDSWTSAVQVVADTQTRLRAELKAQRSSAQP